MAMTELRTCDKYGTTRDVRPFEITVAELGDSDDGAGGSEIVRKSVRLRDLSPRALKLLHAAIDRALAPPKSRQKPGTAPEPT